jgi:GT2 family glycosyltransferase
VAFVDDDVVLGEGWVAAVEGAFHSFPEAVGVTGPAYPLWVGEKVDWLPPEFDWLIGCTKWFRSEHVVEVRNCWGMNMAFSLKYFEDVGGFSPATGYHRGKMPEDLELSLRIRRVTGKKLLYVPDMRVWNKIHPYRLSHKYIVARSSYIGYTRRAIPQNIPNGESAYIFEFSTLASILNSLRPSVIASSRTHLLPLTRITILAMVSIFLGYVFGPFE